MVAVTVATEFFG